MSNKPRIGNYLWRNARPNVYAVYNADYSPSGKLYEKSANPWAVETPKFRFERFATHAEAMAFALEDAS